MTPMCHSLRANLVLIPFLGSPSSSLTEWYASSLTLACCAIQTIIGSRYSEYRGLEGLARCKWTRVEAFGQNLCRS